MQNKEYLNTVHLRHLSKIESKALHKFDKFRHLFIQLSTDFPSEKTNGLLHIEQAISVM